MTKSYADSHLVDVELNSPDRILARSEPWHADDDSTDRHLDPEDTGETIDLNGIKGIPRGALGQLLRFLLPVTSKPGRWKMASVRLAVVCRMLDVDDLGKLPLETLAKELGVTRSLLSMRQLQIADSYGMGKLRSGKSAAARKSYSASATKAHSRRQVASGNNTHKTTVASF